MIIIVLLAGMFLLTRHTPVFADYPSSASCSNPSGNLSTLSDSSDATACIIEPGNGRSVVITMPSQVVDDIEMLTFTVRVKSRGTGAQPRIFSASSGVASTDSYTDQTMSLTGQQLVAYFGSGYDLSSDPIALATTDILNGVWISELSYTITSSAPPAPSVPTYGETDWIDITTAARSFGNSYDAIYSHDYPNLGSRTSPNFYVASSGSVGGAAATLDGTYLTKTACSGEYHDYASDTDKNCSAFEHYTMDLAFGALTVPDVPENYIIEGIEFRVKELNNAVKGGSWNVYLPDGRKVSWQSDPIGAEDEDGFKYFMTDYTGSFQRLPPRQPNFVMTVEDFNDSMKAFRFYQNYNSNPESIPPLHLDVVQYKLHFAGANPETPITRLNIELSSYDASSSSSLFNLGGSFSSSDVLDEAFCRLDFYDRKQVRTGLTPPFLAHLYMNNAVWSSTFNEWVVVGGLVPNELDFSKLPAHQGGVFYANGTTRDWTASLSIQNPLNSTISLAYVYRCYGANYDLSGNLIGYTPEGGSDYIPPYGEDSNIGGADPLSSCVYTPNLSTPIVSEVSYGLCKASEFVYSEFEKFLVVNTSALSGPVNSLLGTIATFPVFGTMITTVQGMANE